MSLCKHCGVQIYPDDQGSWFDIATEGDACTAVGHEHDVHEPEDRGWDDKFQVEYIGPFVNVYLIDKAYGGPEEGGWWYEYGKIIRSKQYLTQFDADAERDTEKVWCNLQNKERMSDIGSVLSEGMYVVYIEDEPGADFPTHTPHYE